MKYISPLLIASFLLGNIFLWTSVEAKERRVLTVIFLDVGQGDAIYIEAPNGNQMLIDGGVGNAVLRELGRVMPFGDRSIDVVIATHPDADHIGGLPDVFARYDVSMFVESGRAGDTAVAEELVRRVKEEKLTPVIAREGMSINIGGGVVFEVVFPDRDVSGVETNLSSIIGKLSYGDTSVLLSGDAPDEIERYVVSRYGAALDADMVKLGHHGSKTSSSEEWLGAISPALAIISRGIDNKYGHPHPDVVGRLTSMNIPFFDTAIEGRIKYESDRREWVRK